MSEIVSGVEHVDFEVYNSSFGYFHFKKVHGKNLNLEILETISSLTCCDNDIVLSTCRYFDRVESVVEESFADIEFAIIISSSFFTRRATSIM